MCSHSPRPKHSDKRNVHFNITVHSGQLTERERERRREALENLAHRTRDLSGKTLRGLSTNITAFISTGSLYLYVILKGSVFRITFQHETLYLYLNEDIFVHTLIYLHT